MDNQTTPKSNANEEIDLLELFNRMGKSIQKGIRWILDLLYKLIILILGKSIWIGSSAVIGIIIGVLFFFITPRFYSSQMVAISNSTNNDVVINSLNQLNELCLNSNHQALANYLNISLLQAEQIKSIKAFYGIDLNNDKVTDYIDYLNSFNSKDTSIHRLKDIFYLKIEVFNESVFSAIRDGIKHYIWSNPYIEENSQIRKEQITDMIAAYSKEIQKLDSLQKDYYFNQITQRAGNGQIIFLNEKDVKLFHKEMLELVAQKQLLQKDMTLNPDPITIIQDFTQLSQAENPWTKYVKFWGLWFAIFGFIAGICWQHKKAVFTFLRKNILDKN